MLRPEAFFSAASDFTWLWNCPRILSRRNCLIRLIHLIFTLSFLQKVPTPGVASLYGGMWLKTRRLLTIIVFCWRLFIIIGRWWWNEKVNRIGVSEVLPLKPPRPDYPEVPWGLFFSNRMRVKTPWVLAIFQLNLILWEGGFFRISATSIKFSFPKYLNRKGGLAMFNHFRI